MELEDFENTTCTGNGSLDLDVIDLNDEADLSQSKRSTKKSSAKESKPPSLQASRRKTSQLMLSCDEPNQVLLSGIFSLDDKTYDVSLCPSSITFTIISGKLKGSKATSGRRMSIMKVEGDKMEIAIKDLCGVGMKKAKGKATGKPNLFQGIELHTFAEKDTNKLKHQVLTLTHPSESICSGWIEHISKTLNSITGRPKLARCYECVEGSYKSDYQSKVLPIFEAAKLELKTFEGHSMEEISKDIEILDTSRYDCILVCGGDSTVNHVIDGLLKKVQFDNGIVLGGKESPQACSVPVGVIPCGSSSTIAHTVFGTSDMVTAALQIVYGKTLLSDVLSISYTHGGFYKFAFSAHYGFGGTIMNAVNKSRIAANNYQLALVKALTKSKIKSYDCEVKYKHVADSFGGPKDGNTCRAGCLICNNESSTPCPDGTNYSDPLQAFDPLDVSNSSSQLSEMTQECGMAKGEFLNVSLFATASSCDMAPLGLSKYTHIADGCMDLVLVHTADRKDFIRFLKRHGNSKNQLDFPFVQSHRVKEASFHVRMPVGWNFRNQDYSEIDDQSKQSRAAFGEESIKVVADGDRSVISELHFSDSDSSNEDDGRDSVSSRTNSATTSLSEDQRVGSGSKDGSRAADLTPAAGRVHAIHKYTETDRRLKKKRIKDMKKEMKAKAKKQKEIKSVWNVDSAPCTETDLTFKVHQKLVTFYGTGMSTDAVQEDVFCFPAI